MLEIASRSTGQADANEKRAAYGELGITEYWRFDETGQYHGTKLAGDRLAEGHYEPIAIEQLPDGSLQGYSLALNLNLRWENSQLLWYDPATDRPILTYEDQRERANDAEARIRELEEEIHRLRDR